MYTTLSNPEVFWKLHLDIIDFHKNFKNHPILFKYNLKVKYANYFFLMTGVIAVLACTAFPIVDFLFLSKKKVLCFGFLIPFTDPDENFGYFLTYVFQILQVVILAYGYITFTRIYWLYCAHANVIIDVLENSVEALNENITDDNDEGQNQLLTKKLSDIVKLHNAFLRFLN